ncbi:hypothetical protein BUALT_Bualt13G0025400 [Buddleja alternifolia]|uniref:G3BP-like protein n=1 Tax=Buddleja alternifolia TaxID=168488 RepID=A0AAV6WQX4_9LAMI|nr:hypothetical protein BUALT_Bualt13G0025400 [Buddleja alternifolia]
MANQYAAGVTATQVGSYFVQQYYQVFQQQREYVHQFYNSSSSMIRVDGEINNSAMDMVQIHELITSLNFTGIEIKTINALDSWNGGLLVVVSGSVKSRDFSGWRKFVQSFFLAPQEKGFFVLNDMFHFVDEEVAHQSSAPAAQEHNVDYQTTISTHLPDPPDVCSDEIFGSCCTFYMEAFTFLDLKVSAYALEEEAAEYVNSVYIKGDEPVQEYNYQDNHQPEYESEPEPELQPKPEGDRLEEESHVEESSAWLQSTVTAVQEPQFYAEEPIGEPEKLTYASILRAKGRSTPSRSSQPAFTQIMPPAADDWNHVSQPVQKQSAPTLPNSDVEAIDEALSLEEGESKSVYVRNLPSSVTSNDILLEFKNFGKIKHDGVFLKNRMDTGVCYAFVEFEDVQSVRNAIEASPIQLAGRQVYIEERRPNAGGASRGGSWNDGEDEAEEGVVEGLTEGEVGKTAVTTDLEPMVAEACNFHKTIMGRLTAYASCPVFSF